MRAVMSAACQMLEQAGARRNLIDIGGIGPERIHHALEHLLPLLLESEPAVPSGQHGLATAIHQVVHLDPHEPHRTRDIKYELMSPVNPSDKSNGDLMIRLTRLNHAPMVLNSDLIEHIDITPDTVITLTNGQILRVLESADEVVDRSVAFRRRIWNRDWVRGKEEEFPA